ncbi:MAG TPA: DoxX family protein [Flavobacteriales bacterium]|nr:DoxX family protein [Flavobacteriales bacterium]
MNYILLFGRVFYSLIFMLTITSHFGADAIKYAEMNEVPAANILVPLSGIIAFAGGLCIALGYQARVGAVLIVLFLVPVTFFMHAFWKMDDPQQYQMQMIAFTKNLSLLGGAFIIGYFGSGPASIDALSKR